MYPDRIADYRLLENKRQSKLLVYVTGDREGLETKIGKDVYDFFVYHLDAIGEVEKISLYLYTTGGITSAAWSIVNLIKQFCKELEIIVPSKARSAGTLMCLGANKIVMTKQATLGPIDPSVDYPLNPQLPGAPPLARVPVSVEDIGGFIDYARTILGEKAELNQVYLLLSGAIHPLVLGNAFRARGQIRMLGEKLIRNQTKNDAKIKKILNFLCSESGSHDYTINRREAQDELKLPIEKPGEELYGIIKRVYDDISEELKLREPFNPKVLLGANPGVAYCHRRAIIESIKGGSHIFMSEGELKKRQIQMPTGLQDAIEDNRTFEAWKHENRGQ